MSECTDSAEQGKNPYRETSFRSDAIPKQAPLNDPGAFARALEGLNTLERLPTGSYAGLDIDVNPEMVESFQERAAGEMRLAGPPPWNHEAKPSNLIKTRWHMLLLFAGGACRPFCFWHFYFLLSWEFVLFNSLWNGATACCTIYSLATFLANRSPPFLPAPLHLVPGTPP